MLATITTTARISDSRREHRTAEFALQPRVASFPERDLEGCIIVSIGLPDPNLHVAGKAHAGRPYPYRQGKCHTRSRTAVRELRHTSESSWPNLVCSRERESRSFRYG